MRVADGHSERRPLVCVVSEALGLPGDEGVRNFAASLLAALRAGGRAVGLAVGGGGAADGVERVPADRLFLSPWLARRLRDLSPELVVYVPTASATLFSFWRARVLQAVCPAARVAMVSLQPRRLRGPSRALARVLRPSLVFAQAPWTMRTLQAIGCTVRFLPSGVDLERFLPVSQEEKEALRRRLGLPPSEFLALHVGHVKPGRNLEALRHAWPVARPVVVAATSMGRDPYLAASLAAEAGAIVLEGYRQSVQEVYQACDCYLFPVQEPGCAIDVPLSVLEAMACNLPVITYPYGGLPLMFVPGNGLYFLEDWAQLPLLLSEARVQPSHTREMVERYGWAEVASHLLAHALGVYAL
ncbi:MAG TPA: glycosyltransferase [Dehalococcoidia bacterium]|nr:glycosyltransferase [Dehalococcoidia bacterium]